LSSLIKNIRFSLGRIIGNSPYLFPLFYLSPSRKNAIIRSDSDICIEGFQRSGNTFFHFAFKRWNRGCKRAHHTHSVGQVLRAIQLGKPTIVLIRNPADAVSSLLVKDLNLEVGNALKSYIDFYAKLAPLHMHFVIGKFEDVIDQPGILIQKINEKYDTDFHFKTLTEKNKDRYKQIIQNANATRESTSAWQRSSVPSEAKNEAKRKVKEAIEKNPLFVESQKIYHTFIN